MVQTASSEEELWELFFCIPLHNKQFHQEGLNHEHKLMDLFYSFIMMKETSKKFSFRLRGILVKMHSCMPSLGDYINMKPNETMEKDIYLIAQSAGLVPELEMPSLLQGYSGNPVQDSQHPWQLLRNQYQCQAGIQRKENCKDIRMILW